ncbi:restriction endonuclease subunit S [Acinetobacter baumannii]|uniref:Restriction endonuclease subunit S n=7 Tax=Acinetobacter calcoaceticus/baumannii complex TaxID=909768 RepID=A0A8I0F7P8_ACIBA|nr:MULTISPECIES: restriction endonuclease subunit S [Acinetobacter]ELA7467049.1 restriction endonuclease subunit S [Acinetobacter nosocomialis]EKU5414136.1 restriction endonuclease subunit S [Acinetobacter baumannii]EKV7757743.1 restriction endonuclease subunit S [Acinetobacter baumannii]EKW8718480.1 restriction endonuclease subunit S [Acinetobacter baumannii]EKX6282011.1 restriction endonuclease subunit S [Acinetobacter baumannii]
MKSVRFGDLCKLQNGRAFKPEEWSEEGTPIVRIQNLNDETKPFNYCNFDVEKRFWINSGDLLFSWSGTPGTSFGAFFWNRGKGFLNQHIFRVDVKEELVDKHYLRYALNSLIVKIIDQAHGGVGLKHITKAKLEEVQIPLPSLAEQRRIASILDQADELRQKRQQAIEKLDQLLQATFIDMFGDPISNPKNWNKCLLEKVTHKITDGTHKTPTYMSSGIEFLSAKDIKKGRIVWNTNKYISEQEHSQLIKRCNPEIGDVVLAKSGSLGSVAIIDRSHQFSLFESLCLIKHDRQQIDAIFLTSMLRSPSMLSHLLGKNKGIAIKHLHLVDIRELEILLPPIELQLEFSSKIRSIDKLIGIHLSSLEYIESLFKSLQNQAFSGTL